MVLLCCWPRRWRGQGAGRLIHQDALGPRGHEMLGLGGANEAGGPLAPLQEIGRTRTRVVGIGCKDVDEPFLQHALRPIARPAAGPAGERPRGDLHPDAACRELLDHAILGLDPGQPFRMGQDGHISSGKDAEKQVLQAGGRHVMREFHQDIGRIAKRQQMSLGEAVHEVRDDMVLGSGGKYERYPCISDSQLQPGYRLPDGRSGVRVKARQDMRGAGNGLHALIRIDAGHRQRGAQIWGSVVDAWEQVTMKIEHLKVRRNGDDSATGVRIIQPKVALCGRVAAALDIICGLYDTSYV